MVPARGFLVVIPSPYPLHRPSTLHMATTLPVCGCARPSRCQGTGCADPSAFQPGGPSPRYSATRPVEVMMSAASLCRCQFGRTRQATLQGSFSVHAGTAQSAAGDSSSLSPRRASTLPGSVGRALRFFQVRLQPGRILTTAPTAQSATSDPC
jgi:hypothetical protein